MIIPAAMNIESAADSLKSVDQRWRDDQLKELRSFGDARARALGAAGITKDFAKGYELGLQTARQMLAGSTALMLKGVNPEDVL